MGLKLRQGTISTYKNGVETPLDVMLGGVSQEELEAERDTRKTNDENLQSAINKNFKETINTFSETTSISNEYQPTIVLHKICGKTSIVNNTIKSNPITQILTRSINQTKNLFDWRKYTYARETNQPIWRARQYLFTYKISTEQLEPNTEYTISISIPYLYANPDVGNDKFRFSISTESQVTSTNCILLEQIAVSEYIGKKYIRTFTTPETLPTNLYLSLFHGTYSGNDTYHFVLSDIMLEKGNSKTKYIDAYPEDIFTISSEVLNIMPDYGHGISDEICNYIDLDNHIYHHQVSIRAYIESDSTNSSVLTDGTTTVYKLDEEELIDLTLYYITPVVTMLNGSSNLIANNIGNITYSIKKPVSNYEYITPQLFGAKGNGINDDTIPLCEFFNAEYNNKIIPMGTYLTTGIITHNLHDCKISGYGAKIINTRTTAKYDKKYSVINASNDMHITTDYNKGTLIIEGLEIDGTSGNYDFDGSYNPTAQSGYGIKLYEYEKVFIKDCYVHDTVNHGINAYGTKSLNVENTTVYYAGYNFSPIGYGYNWDAITSMPSYVLYGFDDPKVGYVNCKSYNTENTDFKSYKCTINHCQGGAISGNANLTIIESCEFNDICGLCHEHSAGSTGEYKYICRNNVYDSVNTLIMFNNHLRANSIGEFIFENNTIIKEFLPTWRTYTPEGNTTNNEGILIINSDTSVTCDVQITNNIFKTGGTGYDGKGWWLWITGTNSTKIENNYFECNHDCFDNNIMEINSKIFMLQNNIFEFNGSTTNTLVRYDTKLFPLDTFIATNNKHIKGTGAIALISTDETTQGDNQIQLIEVRNNITGTSGSDLHLLILSVEDVKRLIVENNICHATGLVISHKTDANYYFIDICRNAANNITAISGQNYTYTYKYEDGNMLFI